ncbi:MAG: transposase [Phycisphaeraceae bacterium]|nr:transposase [Phycisphaeraceae bacterium]
MKQETKTHKSDCTGPFWLCTKVAVFGLLKGGGKVDTQMIADCKRDTLMPIIHQRITPDSVVYSDAFASYSTLSAEGCFLTRLKHRYGSFRSNVVVCGALLRRR